MEALSVVERLWPFALSTLGLVVWLVRLEGNVKANRTSIGRLSSALSEAKEDIEKVEANLHAQIASLQVDMKQILAEVSRIGGFLFWNNNKNRPE